MKIEDIKAVLSHRYPFLLIDRVKLIENDAISAIKNVSANEGFFQGHFPEKNVMPGVLLIECMAQAGVLLILSKEELIGKIAYLTDVDKAKFRRVIVPGDVLNISVKILKTKGNIIKCSGEISVDDMICARATFNCIVQ